MSWAARRLRRGEVVEYDGNLYLCQPNGTFCYLYDHPHDIGILNRVSHIVRVSHLVRVDQHGEKAKRLYAEFPATSKKGSPKTS